MADQELKENLLRPLHTFRFKVEFWRDSTDRSFTGYSRVHLCSGAFSECTGLEATMEPKVIKEGGTNYGGIQRPGRVNFATVVLKRGMTVTPDLWKWFEMVNVNGSYAYRLAVDISLEDNAGNPAISWFLDRALPVKFKFADLNAKGGEIGVEELHLVHEGLYSGRA